jgi:signal transduction histidine kinase
MSIHRSVFFRLIAIMLAAVLLTFLVLGYFFRSIWNPETQQTTELNLTHYAELLTTEIGVPPDTIIADSLSQRLRLGIAVRSPDSTWWISSFLPPIVQEHLKSDISSGSPRAGLVRGGRMLAVVPRHDHIYLYGSRRRQPIEIRSEDWLVLLGAILLISFATWMVLRRELYPVRALARGVRAVEVGNLDMRVPEVGNREFAVLARSFNAMTTSLKERLLARNQLLLDVSHELRSPLTRMRVALEMAEPGSAVDSLRDEVVALEKMVSEILETERLNGLAGGLKLVPGNLSALVADTVTSLEGAPPGLRLVAPSGMPYVPMDAERMRLVLRNIIENALKYGQASLQPVNITLRHEGEFAVVEVRDGGPGVPQEEQRLIFEPFYRTDRSRSGMQTPGYGLGLPLCKRIVEAHGGTIDFDSRPGDTTVTIRMPLG